MEKTTRNYSTSTYEYFKNLFEMEIGWLQFLASFGRIKNTISFDLEYQLEMIKMEMIDKLDTFLDNNNREEALCNIFLAKEYLEECLKKKGLDYVIPYINNGLDEKQINDFQTLVYIRKFVKSISSDLRSIGEPLLKDSDEYTRTLNMLISQVTTLIPRVYLSSSEYNESFLDFYVGECGISFDKDGSFGAYNYMVIMLLDRINSYICYMLPSELQERVVSISNYFVNYDNQTFLEPGANYNIKNLIQAFDGLRNNIDLLKEYLNALSMVRNEEAKKELK